MSALSSGDSCTVLWTSGTTGKAKVVMQSHNALRWTPCICSCGTRLRL